MFEKVSQMAERVATRASRREFLGRLGRGAMVLAAAMGGLLALPQDAQAAKHCGEQICPSGYNYCCSYYDTLIKKRVRECSVSPCRE